jgi:hypothetical protein
MQTHMSGQRDARPRGLVRCRTSPRAAGATRRARGPEVDFVAMRRSAAAKPVSECDYTPRSKNGRLNRLFRRWARQCGGRACDFHRDGIVDEGKFRSEKRRVLFVLLEPNSKGGRFDKHCGSDLRALWHDVPLKKSLDRNLARWTRLLLDNAGRTTWKPTPSETKAQLQRVAIINLKKMPGGGTADAEAIGAHAWQDRKFLRKQIRIIAPDFVVACGLRANKVLGWVLHDDLQADVHDDLPWRVNGLRVLPGNHPSLRPYQAAGALRRLRRMVRLAGLATHRS